MAVQVIAGDVQSDLALIEGPTSSKSATFSQGRGVRPGDDIVVVGFPLHGLLTSDPSVTTGNVSALAGPGDDRRFLQITAPVLVNDSGFGTSNAQFIVTQVPDFSGVMFAGTMDAGDLPFGCGSRCVGGMTVSYTPVAPSGHRVTQTIDMTIIPGLDRVQFWYRDPFFCVVGGYNLSSVVTQ